MTDETDHGHLRFFPSDLIEELDIFSRLFLNVKAEGFGSDPKIESLNSSKKKQGDQDRWIHFRKC